MSLQLFTGFHSCGIHSTAVPGFVDSIVMKFSLWGSLHSCLGFVCCSAHYTAVCRTRRVHSAYWSHAVTPLSAPQLSAAVPYSTAVHYGIHYSSSCSTAICHRSLPLSNFFVGLILLVYLVVFAPFEIILLVRSCKSVNVEAKSFFCRKQFRSPDYGSGWGGCYKCPSPQDVVEYSCTSVNGFNGRTYNGAIRAGKMYQLCTAVSP